MRERNRVMVEERDWVEKGGSVGERLGLVGK